MSEHEPVAQPPVDPLALLRGVDSAPAHDLEWALHCTRQQAVIVRLLLPEGRPPASIETLSDALQIPIWTEPELGRCAIPVYSDEHRAILIDAALPAADQVRAALLALKYLIDLPARQNLGVDAFSEDDYRYLAQRFAELVLERHGP
jgi:hypothetical protein